MRQACPSIMGEGEICANSLMVASDAIANTNHVMERSILKDLKVAIRVRAKVANSYYSGGDEGHKYFLDVLTYCWSVLNSLPKSERNKKNDVVGEAKVSEEGTANPFDALTEDDDDEEDDLSIDDDEQLFPSQPVKRPSLPAASKPLSLDELLNSDVRHDACLFFLTLNDIMGNIAGFYRHHVYEMFLKWERNARHKSTIVGNLIETAVGTNLFIQQVQQLETDLEFYHEHLTTPYRVLATLAYPEVTEKVTAIVREHSKKEGCTEKDVSIYLGDCLESCYRQPNDPCKRKDGIVNDFCRKWKVDLEGKRKLSVISTVLEFHVIQELPMANERSPQACANRQKAAVQIGAKTTESHVLMSSLPFIGGDRAIHHTLRLLQGFRCVAADVPHDKCMEARRVFFGNTPWVAKTHTGGKIRDLDELLMTEILPKWLMLCRHGLIGKVSKMPFEDEISPLFGLMRKFFQEPKQPVTWSITFAVHAMLTAIVEVEPIFDKLVPASKVVFDNFFKQIEWAKIQSVINNKSTFSNSTHSVAAKTLERNLSDMASLQNLGLSILGDRGLWNPLCAGTVFSYLTYFGNLIGGCSIIDYHGQLRVTLHLFHAFLVTGILQTGEIPMLDWLYEIFRDCKGIWRGPLPQRGEFVQRYWSCNGNSVIDARAMSDGARQRIRGNEAPRNNTRKSDRKHYRGSGINITQISKSYRRVCRRNFYDTEEITTPEESQKLEFSEYYSVASRTIGTMRAIQDEHKLMSLNLASCGVIIEEFVIGLGNHLEFESLQNEVWRADSVKQNDQRRSFLFPYAQYLLGALDFADDPLQYEFRDKPLGKASSEFMVNFFTKKIRSSTALWFQPSETVRTEG